MSAPDDPAARLFARRSFGVKPGLGTMRALLSRLGDPQSSFRVLHVAGTDGKGSVCEMLHSVLRACGIRAGLYTSPHLVRFRERIRIGAEEIGEDALGALVEEVEKAAADVAAAGGAEATFFEMATAIAALHFAREGVRLAVAEVGMGGRLDATNALPSAVSVVTRIGLDHTQWLGDTLEKIALEKAGIARKGVPLVLGAMPEEAAAAACRRAAETGAPVVLAPEAVSVRRTGGDLRSQTLAVASEETDYGRVELGLAASYQIENAATAVAALETFGRAIGVALPADAVKKGLAGARVRARFQLLSDDPPVILDGAHNPCAAAALVSALKAAKAGRSVRLVCGMCEDKDSAGFLREIAPVAGKVWTVPLATPRGRAPETLAALARGAGIRETAVAPSVESGLAAARADAAAAGRPVVVAGSLYLAGEILAAREGSSPDPGELLHGTHGQRFQIAD